MTFSLSVEIITPKGLDKILSEEVFVTSCDMFSSWGHIKSLELKYGHSRSKRLNEVTRSKIRSFLADEVN